MKDFTAFFLAISKFIVRSPILHGLIMGTGAGQLFKDGHHLFGFSVWISFAVMSWFMVRGGTAMDTIDRIRKARE